MQILHEDNGKKGSFYITGPNDRLAEMVYVWAGSDKFIIEHTEVSDQLSGKGAGKQMVAAAVSFARERGVKIIPLCPFAKSVFNKTREYQDVL